MKTELVAVYERKVVFKRTIVVELKPSEKQKRFLAEWADNCAALWNIANYRRRQTFFKTGKVDLKEDKVLYQLFKPLVSNFARIE